MSTTQNQDYMIRAIAGNQQIRAFAITSKELVEAARSAHDTAPVCTAALGRTMSGALMMAAMLKEEDALLTIQFDGDGPIHGITVTADNHGNVKGYVGETEVDLPPKSEGHLDVGGAVGHGTLTVIRDADRDHTYNGQVAIHSGEIADDLTHYFAESEQIPSVVGLGVLVNPDRTVRCAGGYIIQLMPFAEEETISRLEENIQALPYVTEMLDAGLAPEEMLSRALEGFDLEITETNPVQFHCNCSRDRVTQALRLLGEVELQSILNDGKDIDLSCQFCGSKYHYNLTEIAEIKASL